MEEGNASQQVVGSWLVENLRLSMFVEPTLRSEVTAWWKAAVGEDPVSITEQPKLGVAVAQGPVEGGVFTLGSQPGRIDLLYAAALEEGSLYEGFPFLGPVAEVLPTFVSLINRWFQADTCPDAYRIAFGAVLIDPVETRAEGYGRLQPFLPSVQIDKSNSSDLLYQINRPRTLNSVRGLLGNRLSKWSVGTLQALVGNVLSPDVLHGQEYYAVRLELDLSTDKANREKIAAATGTSIFDELVTLALEISSEGDKP